MTISTRELLKDKDLLAQMLDSMMHRIEMLETAVIVLVKEKNERRSKDPLETDQGSIRPRS